ncbi:MAG TPA: hypothetical protein VGM88_14615 [Kofleriaceae bacterium]
MKRSELERVAQAIAKHHHEATEQLHREHAAEVATERAKRHEVEEQLAATQAELKATRLECGELEIENKMLRDLLGAEPRPVTN